MVWRMQVWRSPVGSARSWAEEVPPVASDIHEDRNTSVGLVSRFSEELNPGGGHSLVCRLEFIDAKEEADATCNLVADCRSLDRPVRAGDQKTSGRSGRANYHPSLWSTVVSQGR